MVPEERLGRGAVPSLSLAQNLLLTRTEAVKPSGWIDLAALRRQAAHIITSFRVKAGGPSAVAQSLSGGNLQKFIVGREMAAQPRLLILSQPTWGVDVGAAAQILALGLSSRKNMCIHPEVAEEGDKKKKKDKKQKEAEPEPEQSEKKKKKKKKTKKEE